MGFSHAGLSRKVPHWHTGAGLVQTIFTQSLGPNLVTNPSFDSWTDPNTPDGWVATPSDATRAINEVDSGGGAGTGAAEMVNTSAIPLLTQDVCSVGSWYQVGLVTSLRTGGSTRFTVGNARWIDPSTVDTWQWLNPARNDGTVRLNHQTAGSAVHDSVSIQLITPNETHSVNADGTHEFEFTLPTTTYPGQCIMLHYRLVDSLNLWTAAAIRNPNDTVWELLVHSWVAGIETKHVDVIVGNLDAIRVVTSGDDHEFFTRSLGVWTQRGGTVTNSAHNTATGLRAMYVEGTTPIRLSSQ